MPEPQASILFQAGKLGHLEAVRNELSWARHLEARERIHRIYGLSAGNLTAFAMALAIAAKRQPERFAGCRDAIEDVSDFLAKARRRDLRGFNLNPWYGIYNLRPIRAWVSDRLHRYGLSPDLLISSLPIELYLCAGDRDGTLTLFGPSNPDLRFDYTWVPVGPPQDAPLVDALIAGLSTSLSIEPASVNGSLYRDCRPAISDASAIIADLEAASPRPIHLRQAHTPAPPWQLNWITSSFIMHRHHERNQAVLARYYIDLLERHRALQVLVDENKGSARSSAGDGLNIPTVTHIDLPYIGSTEAFTNMRQSVADKDALMERFQALLAGQFESFGFSQSSNVIYGAGGFSGILAGLVTTRQVEAGFKRSGGSIKQIYGVSAGVLNGFFHAIQVAANNQPDLYTSAAADALQDLELFFEAVTPGKIASINLNPFRFWQGWANLNPLKHFLRERLNAYTGTRAADKLTFDDIQLPLTVAVARNDGFTDFLGMTRPRREMQCATHDIHVRPARIIEALIAGWSMNTYIHPTRIGEQTYRDGGGSFYDPALFVACMDQHLENLLNIHLDEPEGHSYNLPERPNLVRLLFDTHNYNFPEERRRMRFITDLLFDHFALRAEAQRSGIPLPPDFRREWILPEAERILAQRYFKEHKEL